MTSKRYLGNIITDTPTEPTENYENSAASGVWSLAEAFAYTKAGLWPTQGNSRPSIALFSSFYPTDSIISVNIDKVVIETAANAVDFGDLTLARYDAGAFGSDTRGIYVAGYNQSSLSQNVMDYVTFATAGNATDFGDTITKTVGNACASSNTRGITSGGYDTDATTYLNTIEYVTIASTGNGTDFGDLTVARGEAGGTCSSSTRGVFGGGFATSADTNVIDYVTIASTGSATDFGDLTIARDGVVSTGNATRGLWCGGRTSVRLNTIDYVTIATTGNAADFGDLLYAAWYMGTAANSTTALVAAGSDGSTGYTNQIQSLTIGTLGNGVDFADLTQSVSFNTGVSSGFEASQAAQGE